MIHKFKNNFGIPFLLSIIMFSLFGCAALEDDDETSTDQKAQSERTIGQTPGGSQPLTNQQRQEEGMIRIHRHGPGYDVSMDINASDENIAFLMDLPQQKQTDKLKKNIYTSMKLVMDAQALFYKKDYAKAQTNIEQAIELAPDNPHAYALQGSILFKLQKNQDAIHSWQRALELDPSLTEVRTTLKKLGIKQ